MEKMNEKNESLNGKVKSQIERSQDVYRLGYNLIPVNGKFPPCESWKRWESERIGPDQMCDWGNKRTFQRKDGGVWKLANRDTLNWGLLTGEKPYSDAPAIVVIDTDDEEAESIVQEQCPDTPVKQQTGSGGWHRIYRRPSKQEIDYIANRQKTMVDGKLVGIDIRGDHGYIMCPGSIHPRTLNSYEWDQPWTRELLESCPVFDPSWIPDERDRKQHTPSSDIDLNDLEHEEAVNSDHLPTVDDRIAQARRYLDSVPGTQQGQGADNACFALTMKLLYGFALPAEDVVNLLCEWGEKDDQLDDYGGYYPWTASQIQHKVNSALSKTYTGEFGDKLKDRKDCYDLEQKVLAGGLHQSDSAPTKSEGSEFYGELPALLRWNDLLQIADSQKNNWIWTDFIDKGTLSMFSGLAGSGKTTVVNNLIAHIGAGCDFLGKSTCRCPILYLNADNFQEKLIVRNISKAMRDLVTNDDLQDIFFFPPNAEMAETEISPDYLEKRIAEINHCLKLEQPQNVDAEKVLIIIDTLRSALMTGEEMGSENDATTMTKKLKPLRAFANQSGASILLLHHNNKGKDEYAGSGAIKGCVHGVWSISRKEHETVSRFKCETREDFRCKLTLEMTQNGLEMIDNNGEQDDEDKVTKFVKKFPLDRWIDINGVMEMTHLKRGTVQNRLKEAETAGLLHRNGEGVKGDPACWKRVQSD